MQFLEKNIILVKKTTGVVCMVVMFESLSRALDAFNANRVEEEQMEWNEVVEDIKNPMDEIEVMRVIIDLYEDAY